MNFNKKNIKMDIEAYRKLLQQNVTYVKDGKMRQGRLTAIGFDRDRLYGRIELPHRRFTFGPPIPIKIIPLECIRTPSSARGSISGSGKGITGNGASHFTFNSKTYLKCSASGYKLGEEVVWKLPDKYQQRHNPNQPYVGIVRFIGKYTDGSFNNAIVALVEFDQSTTHLPNFVSKEGPRKELCTNLVNIEELVILANWLNAQEREGSFDQSDDLDDDTNMEWLPSGNDGEFTVSPNSLSSQFSQAQSSGLSCHRSNLSSSPAVPLYKDKVPIEDLIQLDEEVYSQQAPLSTVRQFENLLHEQNEDWREVFNFEKFEDMIRLNPQQTFGIQGKDHSCYMDTSLFALFCFNRSLDNFISYKINDFPQMPDRDILRYILREEIITPLRQNYFVPYDKIHKLRELFGLADKKMMDAEDFILTLFERIGIPHMFECNNGASDYIHQIVHPAPPPNIKCSLLNLQFLLETSFKEFAVCLKRLSGGLFIVKLPVSNGVLIPCEAVIPELNLSICNIIDKEYKGDRANLCLSAVICVNQNHFVVFARTGRASGDPWVYMDSKPTGQTPYVRILYHTGRIIEELLIKKSYVSSTYPEDELQFVRELMRHAYICIYSH